TPEPGKRAVSLGINGWGNLGDIIGSELSPAKYGPEYIWPLKLPTGLIAVEFVGYAYYYSELEAWNKYKARKIARMSAEEMVAEYTNHAKCADKKWTFAYGV
ncbi:hypothetical protein P171DRAFT_370932, partial [Karstenula rhodostoma CBS 690.94]